MHLRKMLGPDLAFGTNQSGVIGLCPGALCRILHPNFGEFPFHAIR
jgi:hypothetical protein